MHPQIMTWPPPCFTVGFKCFVWRDVFGLHHTYFFPSEPKMFNLLSSENITFFQNSNGLFTFALANSSLFFLFISLIYGFFLGVLPLICSSWRIFHTVWGLTIIPDVDAISMATSWELIDGFFDIYLMMSLRCLPFSFFGHRERSLFSMLPVSSFF